jgi:D-alanyl-D-alanine carboxypeptidase (penicillin-binding protein 5/6)
MGKIAWLIRTIFRKNIKDNFHFVCVMILKKRGERMKRFLSIFFMSIFIMNLFFIGEVKGEPNEQRELKIPYINARCAIAIDAKSKRVLFEKSSGMIVPMASTTKILTALVALKYGDLDRKIEISDRASSIRGSTVGYKKGAMISLRELIYGLMLRSGNDAAIAIAEGISGSVDEFLKLMNEYALEIGLVDSHFESPHGLDSENHYTTAYDLALITAKAREIEEFNKIVSQKDVDGNELNFTRSFHNINKILWQLPEATGVKTGYTGQAGKCLVTSVNYSDNDIVIVVLNSPGRWKETSKIYDYITKKYEYKKLVEKDELLGEFVINKGKNKITFKSDRDIIMPVKKDSTITKKVLIPKNIDIEVKNGDILGALEIFEDDKKIYDCSLTSSKSIQSKMSLKKWIKSITR